MLTAPGPLFGHTVRGSAHKHTHRALQLSTKWFSPRTALEELVGGMLTLHTIPLYLSNVAYGEVVYLCNNSTQESPIPLKWHQTVCC